MSGAAGAAATAGRPWSFFEAAFWLALWMVASPLVVVNIKTLTTDETLQFPYPWLFVGVSNFGGFLVSCTVLRLHAIVGGRALAPTQSLFSAVATSEADVAWEKAAVLGLMQGVEVGIGAEIIHHISVTLRTEILMLEPTAMYILSFVLGMERVNLWLVISIALVTVGGFMACYGVMTFDGLELVPCALAMLLCSSTRWALTQRWLTPAGMPRPSPLVLAVRMLPFTAIVGFAGAVLRERVALVSVLHLPHPVKVAALLCGISVGLSFMILAELRTVQLTSALLLAFLVPFHNVTVILLDVMLRGTHLSNLNWFGIVLCSVASGLYSIARRAGEKDGTSPSQASVEETAAQDTSKAAGDGVAGRQSAEQLQASYGAIC